MDTTSGKKWSIGSSFLLHQIQQASPCSAGSHVATEADWREALAHGLPRHTDAHWRWSSEGRIPTAWTVVDDEFKIMWFVRSEQGAYELHINEPTIWSSYPSYCVDDN